jgi:hypothetical protein
MFFYLPHFKYWNDTSTLSSPKVRFVPWQMSLLLVPFVQFFFCFEQFVHVILQLQRKQKHKRIKHWDQSPRNYFLPLAIRCRHGQVDPKNSLCTHNSILKWDMFWHKHIKQIFKTFITKNLKRVVLTLSLWWVGYKIWKILV